MQRQHCVTEQHAIFHFKNMYLYNQFTIATHILQCSVKN